MILFRPCLTVGVRFLYHTFYFFLYYLSFIIGSMKIYFRFITPNYTKPSLVRTQNMFFSPLQSCLNIFFWQLGFFTRNTTKIHISHNFIIIVLADIVFPRLIFIYWGNFMLRSIGSSKKNFLGNLNHYLKEYWACLIRSTPTNFCFFLVLV